MSCGGIRLCVSSTFIFICLFSWGHQLRVYLCVCVHDCALLFAKFLKLFIWFYLGALACVFLWLQTVRVCDAYLCPSFCNIIHLILLGCIRLCVSFHDATVQYEYWVLMCVYGCVLLCVPALVHSLVCHFSWGHIPVRVCACVCTWLCPSFSPSFIWCYFRAFACVSQFFGPYPSASVVCVCVRVAVPFSLHHY